jgi:phage major head subunit gpT-like protein
MVTHAIEAGSNPRDFRADLYDTVYPLATAPQHKQRETQVTDNVLTAAVCQAGRLRGIEDHFSDQELQIAHTIFKGRIGLKQLICFCAAAKGYNAGNFTVDLETQRAAFATNDRRQQHGSGFSTLSIANVLAATANKYLHEGWMAIDQTAMRLANVVSVSDFKQITTVSLMGDLQYLKVGADGEIKHGDLQDLTYTNQIDTYARMLQITRKDIINDDLGALTAVPKRLGRGAALKLNDIFWTEFLGLVAAGFFAAGNNNLNAGVATMTLEGLAATETIFLNQTDPDGKPLGIMPKIILVPPALRPAAAAILYPQANMAGTAGQNNNIFAGRYTLESSPYVSNSSYTGYTSVGWWMLADPDELPVIQIAALNGRVEPTVETADADFNVLGVQFRGYSDVGVNEQEKRGGVYADGGAS